MSTSTARLPEASLLEEWTVARTQHWARTSGAFGVRPRLEDDVRSTRPAAKPTAPRDSARDSRRTEHLLRLAGDDRATAAERALAAERAAQLLRRFA
ncbi:hypothetical protein [Nocardioides sp.]|uniref:hypothetical protein n=1 Tax=Nocardioides sp. TaxID=35761 RepID=UPI003511A4B7